MTNIDLLISELITTRICHDLAGSSSAIANGVEFLSGDDEFVQEAKNLIAMSSNSITYKIKLFRLAFGTINNKNADFDNLKTIVNDYVKENPKIIPNWTIETDSTKENDLNKNMILGKLTLLSAMILFDTIPRGGNLNISISNDFSAKVIVSSDKLMISPDLNKLLDSIEEGEDIVDILRKTTPKTIPLSYGLFLSKNNDFQLKTLKEQNLLEININYNLYFQKNKNII